MTGFRLPAQWPLPADAVAAADLAEHLAPLLARALTDAPATGGASPTWTPAVAGLVACLGGNSPYLAGLARREHETLAQLVRLGPGRAAAASLRRLRGLRKDGRRGEVAAGLRRAKRQVALVVAVADLGGLWSLEQVTGTLSLLAEACLRVASAHLLLAAHREGQLVLPDPGRPEHGSGFVVLAMGKLGAGELNYSSDVDLVLLYDPDAQPLQAGRGELGRCFNRLAAGLVALMETPDADGMVFRMDLRLRPDPGATPPAVSLPSALAYYESHGQGWERAAMSKARPVAGDLAVGTRFLEAIRPFVWRRHLDFAAIEDIHGMKRRIDRHKPAPTRGFAATDAADPVAALLGHDLKLGHGGIREIEFVAQTLQLVWGGRDLSLRQPTTLGALQRLAAAGHLENSEAEALAAAYRRLRRIEHRLQMQADRQTHSLPGERGRFEAFATFMGEADGAALAGGLLPVLRATRTRFERMFLGAPAADPADAALPTGTALDPEGGDLAAQVTGLGFPAGNQALKILRGWGSSRYRALREPRARQLLHGMAPTLLRALAAQRDPLAALARFDALLSRQAAGVQLLSLLARNPLQLARIATILGAAPSLADHLALAPGALDGLLVPEQGRQATRDVLRILDAQMRQAPDVEAAIRAARTLVRAEEFRLSVAQMEGRLDADAAGIARTALADRVIVRMLERVLADHRTRHGVVRGGGMSVVALGRAGSREMTSFSDLDLMLIYDHPEAVTESVAVPARAVSGVRPLAASQYYIRLAHALIAALSAPGAEGPLYALDMRLRPSGNKGPVAVSLAAFRRYHAEQAWTWERMALSRARVVAGPRWQRPAVAREIATALSMPHGGEPAARAAALRRDACDMRARLARDLPPHGPWDVKLRVGGLMEVEFVAQILQLASRDVAVRHPTTRIALRRLARAGMLSRAEARMLVEADRFWRALQGMLRILVGVQVPRALPQALGEPVLEALLHGLAAELPEGQHGLEGLERRRDAVATAVRAGFLRLVGPAPD